MNIREATDSDLDTVLDIFNAAIRDTVAIWTEEPIDRANREAWLAAQQAGGWPVFVAVDGDEVLGYSSYAPWNPKPGYRYSVETSVYIADGHRGRGVGRALLGALVEHARASGKHLMVADIESGNAASIRLHESYGFVESGRLPEIGFKFDRWLDLTIMSLRL